jgi:hypothetical protein
MKHSTVLTEDYLYQIYSERSAILFPHGTPEDQKAHRVRFIMLDLSRQGIEQMLQDRREFLPQLNEAWKDARRVWREWRSRQVTMDKHAEPIGAFAETINRTAARKRVCEAEMRRLNEMLTELKAKELEQAEHQRAPGTRAPHGLIKNRDGQPYTCDGRKLFRDAEGDLRFEDDKSLMSEYLNALKARKKAIAVKQRKRIQTYRQEEAKLRGVEYKPEKPLTSVVKI